MSAYALTFFHQAKNESQISQTAVKKLEGKIIHRVLSSALSMELIGWSSRGAEVILDSGVEDS